MSNVSTKMTWLPRTEFQLAVSVDLRPEVIIFCRKYFEIDDWHIKYEAHEGADVLSFKTYDQLDHFINGSDTWTVQE